MKRSGIAFATLLVAGMTFVSPSPASAEPAAPAAPSVRNEVQVGQPAEAPSGAPAPAAAPSPGLDLGGPPAKRVLKRNPFTPPMLPSAAQAATGPATTPGAGGVSTGKGATKKPAAPPEEIPPAPSFALVGLFASNGFPTALIATSTGATEVRVGQLIGQYKVTSINLTTRQVIVEVKNHAFRVSLPKDSPYPTGGGSSNPGGTPPSSGAGVPAAGGESGPLPPPPPPAKGGR